MIDQRRVIGLNNHGVRLLQQRNHRLASQSMLQALHHLKESIKKRPLPDKVPPEPEASQRRTNGFSIHPISPPSQTSSTSTSSSSTLGRDDRTSGLPFQMLDRVFAFYTTGLDPTSLDNRDGSSAMLLYNLGVVNHARGMELTQAGRSAKVSFGKAHQMYTWALGAIQHWARHNVVHEGCHLLRLAILNNLAHVNAMMQKQAQAQHCLKCLRDILTYAKGHVSRNEYAFFSANVVVLCLKGDTGSLTKAPAAAA